MLTDAIKNQIDGIWNAFWSGGISNPLEIVEQIEHQREAAFAEIRREIQLGVDQAKAGQLRDGESFFAELERKRLSSQQ